MLLLLARPQPLTGSLYRCPVIIMAQIILAILLASATAAILGDRRASRRTSQGALGSMPLSVTNDRQGPCHQQLAQITVTLFGDAAQLLLLPPLEFCRGTSPIQAARFLPDLKALGSGTVAIMALARTGPTPGTSISRRPSSVDRA